MRYKPTITLSHKEVDAIIDGTLTIQPGQWVQFTWTDTRSRWVGLMGRTRTPTALHWPTSTKQLSALCNPTNKP